MKAIIKEEGGEASGSKSKKAKQDSGKEEPKAGGSGGEAGASWGDGGQAGGSGGGAGPGWGFVPPFPYVQPNMGSFAAGYPGMMMGGWPALPNWPLAAEDMEAALNIGWSDNRAILSREAGTVKAEREEAYTVKAVREEATRAERVQAEGRPITRGGTPVTTVEVWSTGSTRWFAPNTISIWSSWRPSTREPGGSREERREDNKDPS